jgi:hypothetical protein
MGINTLRRSIQPRQDFMFKVNQQREPKDKLETLMKVLLNGYENPRILWGFNKIG